MSSPMSPQSSMSPHPGTTPSRGILSLIQSRQQTPDPSSKIEGVKFKVSENEAESLDKNPFKLASDTDIFLLREKELQQKQKEQERQKNLKIHEKTTYTAQVYTRRNNLRRLLKEGDPETLTSEEANLNKLSSLKDDPSWKINLTKDRHIEKESLDDYINKKREMFLLQYSLVVKREEMRKLEEVAQAEEKKLEKAEQYLEEDAAMFDEFLKENDRNSAEAMKIAEQETKLKMDKVAEIKRITTQMMGIKSEISKNEEVLKEFLIYRDFLNKLSPKEWLEDKERKKLLRSQSRMITHNPSEDRTRTPPISKRTESKPSVRPSVQDVRIPSKGTSRQFSARKMSSALIQSPPPQLSPVVSPLMENKTTEEILTDSDEEPELYFKDPKQLLQIYTELEEQNLSLILNSQETEEALEEIKQTTLNTERKMNCETDFLKQQLSIITEAIAKEERRAAELQLKAKVFSFSQTSIEDQDQLLDALNRKVGEVYQTCIGINDTNMTTLQMLTNLENHLEEMFDKLEKIPQDKVESAEKRKDKERRARLREDKLREEKLLQEERLQRALIRAQTDHRKKVSRKLMFRSHPPILKQKETKNQDDVDKDKEESMFYFT
ncbi:cilia- and flagella-associated protein 100 [Callorhinchus milii]|uniref:Coiled-coil domain-containing protein 37-like protein n=1 Tax=Callorhinchus milii TaxID=7868 RepID=V9KJB1_CALMI|nr:cilia- and flagella-associated protein 100 [Callorhinchus milii]XP_007888561.1 cilia- and flagella-associated protein 100 [Callorhinchus milii]|eukprot:gi/632946443/ref/XP_007888560.1/ PREDICTED: coiled-coil domain-containing protein 37 [Callorhinchus milii]